MPLNTLFWKEIRLSAKIPTGFEKLVRESVDAAAMDAYLEGLEYIIV